MTIECLQIPCQKIISGGQTGVDRGALDACLKNNFPCGGWCPNGRLAEDGIISDKYPLEETQQKDYSFRTRQNVIDSDATLIISPQKLSGGTRLTQQFTEEYKKPVLLSSPETKVRIIINWLIENKIRIMNVAGPRKSEWNKGYDISFKLTSAIVNEIKKQRPEHKLNH